LARRVSIKRLLVVASLPAVVGPLVALAVLTPWYYGRQEHTLNQSIQADLVQNAHIRAHLVGGLLQNARDAAREVALVWPRLRRDADQNQALRALVSQGRAFREFCVVAPDGRVRYSSNPRRIGTTVAELPLWRRYRAGHGAMTYGLVLDDTYGWVLRAYQPTATGETLRAAYDLDELQAAFENPVAVQEGRLSFLVGSDGRVISHTDPRQIGRDLSAMPPVVQALRGEQGAMNFSASPGSPEQSAAYMPIPDLRLALVMVQPAASTMLVPAQTLEASLLSLLAASILLAWLVSTLMGQRVAAPIVALNAYLQELTRQEVAPERDRRFPPSGIAEIDGVVVSVDKLYDSLAATINELAVRSRELALTNQQLGETVEDLKRLDALRTEFLNVLSHDLRIPLTVLLGYAELLQESPAIGAEDQARVEAMIATCRRMETLLNELLDYARMEAGRLTLHPRPTDLGTMLIEVRDFFGPLASQKGLALDLEQPAELPEAEADPERIRQVLANLVSNAIKYTPSGGRVTLGLRRDKDGATLEVRDTGVGLSPEDRRHLFEKFYRSSRPEVQREKGTGLGLVIARGIVEAHRGHMEVESQEGHGATFRFTLPLTGGPSAHGDAADSRRGG
jgi:signal transduction histidine kinase